MNAKPAAYSLPVFFPGWTVEFDSAPVQTKFQDYSLIASGIVREDSTGRAYRFHASATRAAVPFADNSGVQLNYLGKRAGAPVNRSHVPDAWGLVWAAWNDTLIAIRDARAATPEQVETLSRAETAALYRAERDGAETLRADVTRRADSVVPMFHRDVAALPALFCESVSNESLAASPEGRDRAQPLEQLESGLIDPMGAMRGTGDIVRANLSAMGVDMSAIAKAEQATRRDNVEYYAGQNAKRLGAPADSCPYAAGGERAARWSLGWQEVNLERETLAAIRAALDSNARTYSRLAAIRSALESAGA